MTLTGFNSCSRLTLSHFDFKSVKIVKTSEFHESNLKQRKNARNLALAQLFPAPVCPNTKLSGRNSWPKGPARTLSMVPATTSGSLKQSRQQHTNLRAYSGFGCQECWQILLQIQFLHQICVSVLPKVSALCQLRCTC